MKKTILQIFTAILVLGLFCGAASAASANFNANITSGVKPLTVGFTDQSANATSWQWNFGDGSSNSTEQNPIHTLSLIHISEPTRLGMISYAVFCLKKKKKK